MDTLKLFFDGSCEPINPGGTARWGFVLRRGEEEIHRDSGTIGTGPRMTNNLAEYHALINGLKYVKQNFSREKLLVYGDSALVCNMVSKTWGYKKGRWKPHPKFPHLKALLMEALSLLPKEYDINWVPREQNLEADEMSKVGTQDYSFD